MSTASEGIPTDHPPRTGDHPSALAILTATAVGGVIATRLGKAPLALAAGAAAYALLKPKSHVTSKPVPVPAPEPAPLPPPPPAESTPQNQIEQWLVRQMDRETQLAHVELPTSPEPAPHSVIEDDYQPQSLLMDDAPEDVEHSLSHEALVQLTQPARRLPPPDIKQEPDLPALQALEATESAPTSGAAWLLGVEPLPSVGEDTAFSSFSSRMFSSAPEEEKSCMSPPSFAAPTFQGAALPDEIEVPSQPEPETTAASVEPTPLVHITPTLPGGAGFPAAPAESAPDPVGPPPVSFFAPPASDITPPQFTWAPPPIEHATSAPAAKTIEPSGDTPEIPVQVASPGEASFDPPPLENVLDNPWQPPPELVAKPSPVVAPPPVPPTPAGPVVEAEIVLRPRAPTQNAVIPKSSKPVSPRFAKNIPPDNENQEASQAPAESEDKSLPPAPVQTPREQRARPTWRSWWRGD
ncbi:hypothetical protein [Prosthecobacter sp.]|uniref:hypothetical protein n=1 Tax=Prosthecobacter sp. TaxID=1965333 RepID=UPI001D966A83|nr:hypothetical protein [Prosthecobacter sp.]MCB1275773.1 hypothetical protein [Prosthecobacter sp.]